MRYYRCPIVLNFEMYLKHSSLWFRSWKFILCFSEESRNSTTWQSPFKELSLVGAKGPYKYHNSLRNILKFELSHYNVKVHFPSCKRSFIIDIEQYRINKYETTFRLLWYFFQTLLKYFNAAYERNMKKLVSSLRETHILIW